MEFITIPYKPRVQIVRRNGVTVGQVTRSYEHGDKWIAHLKGADKALLYGDLRMARTFDSKEDAAWALVDATPTAYQLAMEQEHAR